MSVSCTIVSRPQVCSGTISSARSATRRALVGDDRARAASGRARGSARRAADRSRLRRARRPRSPARRRAAGRGAGAASPRTRSMSRRRTSAPGYVCCVSRYVASTSTSFGGPTLSSVNFITRTSSSPSSDDRAAVTLGVEHDDVAAVRRDPAEDGRDVGWDVDAVRADVEHLDAGFGEQRHRRDRDARDVGRLGGDRLARRSAGRARPRSVRPWRSSSGVASSRFKREGQPEPGDVADVHRLLDGCDLGREACAR